MTAADLDRLEELEAAATKGPWSYNGYNAIHALSFSEAEEKVLADYESAGSPKDDLGRPPMEWREKFYEANTDVCHVPPIAGDTATGRHAKDAAFIEALRNQALDLIALTRKGLELEKMEAMATRVRGGTDVR